MKVENSKESNDGKFVGINETENALQNKQKVDIISATMDSNVIE